MTEQLFLYFIIFLFGSSVGSFLNVCIYRLPREESIISPRSHCTICNKPILTRDNIPILSYILLRGRCRNCGEKFSVIYPFIEFLTGIIFLYFFYFFGFNLKIVPYLVLTCSLIVISVIDINCRIIPNEISIPFIFLGILFTPLLPIKWSDSLLGILFGGGILYSIAVIYALVAKKEGMGMGDVKLLAMIGAFLGIKGAVVTLLLGSFLGTIGGFAAILLSGKGRDYPIPFGVFLSIGAVISLLWGNDLLDFYLGLMGGGR